MFANSEKQLIQTAISRIEEAGEFRYFLDCYEDGDFRLLSAATGVEVARVAVCITEGPNVIELVPILDPAAPLAEREHFGIRAKAILREVEIMLLGCAAFQMAITENPWLSDRAADGSSGFA